MSVYYLYWIAEGKKAREAAAVRGEGLTKFWQLFKFRA